MDDRMRARLRARLVATASLMTVAGCEPKRDEPAASVDGAHADVPADAAAVADATTIEASVSPIDAAAETVDAVPETKAETHQPAAKPAPPTQKKKPWVHVMI